MRPIVLNMIQVILQGGPKTDNFATSNVIGAKLDASWLSDLVVCFLGATFQMMICVLKVLNSWRLVIQFFSLLLITYI